MGSSVGRQQWARQDNKITRNFTCDSALAHSRKSKQLINLILYSIHRSMLEGKRLTYQPKSYNRFVKILVTTLSNSRRVTKKFLQDIIIVLM